MAAYPVESNIFLHIQFSACWFHLGKAGLHSTPPVVRELYHPFKLPLTTTWGMSPNDHCLMGALQHRLAYLKHQNSHPFMILDGFLVSRSIKRIYFICKLQWLVWSIRKNQIGNQCDFNNFGHIGQNFITWLTAFHCRKSKISILCSPTHSCQTLGLHLKREREEGGTWQWSSPTWIFPAFSWAPGSMRALVASERPGL